MTAATIPTAWTEGRRRGRRPEGYVRISSPRAALSAVFAVLLLGSGMAWGQMGPVVARAASVNGRNLLYSAGDAPIALTAGSILNPGDRIDTRGGGRVVIDLSDGSMVVVQPESVVVLKDFQQASSLRELFEITVGMVRVKINHFAGRPNPYRMNSPTASIAVRGTEFTIEVGVQGDTQVVVYEGAVEVTSLQDPDRKTLIEAGRGVLVQAGQDFHLFSSPALRGGDAGGHNDGDHDRRAGAAMASAGGPPQMPMPQQAGPNATGQGHNPPGTPAGPVAHADRDDSSPRATASTYDRYIDGLSDIAQVPFLFRYNAFAEPYLDSLENPAYATGFTRGEGRVFVLPTFRGLRGLEEEQAAFGPGGTLPGDYSISPEVALFTPVAGTQFTVGGSASVSRVGNTGLSAMPSSDPSMLSMYDGSSTSGSSTGTFYSGALVAARRFGSSSLGVEVEGLKGTGSLASTTTGYEGGTSTVEQFQSASDVSQTRLTAGYSKDFAAGHAKLGVFYRYAFISANDADQSHTIAGLPGGLNSTRTSGHSSELGLRLRGALTRRLSYGIAGAWLALSLEDGLVRTNAVDSHQHDRSGRGSLAFGLGYALTRRVMLSFDAAGGAARNAATRTEDSTGNTLQNGDANSHFVSAHTAVQADVTRHLFLSASFMNVWQRHSVSVDSFPDRSGNSALVEDSFFPFTPYQLGCHFSDFGAGWRFSPNLFAQYLYSTDYGVSTASHTVMLRYTFRLKRE